MDCELEDKIFDVSTDNFDALAIEIFQYQYDHNHIYRQYCQLVGADRSSIRTPANIPFLPIHFFKTHPIRSGDFEPELIFESSGTTGSTPSRHFVGKAEMYRSSFFKGFSAVYGDPADYCILGLLPSYLERNNSSLVYMTKELIDRSVYNESGFYLEGREKLAGILQRNHHSGIKTVLIGVTFALLDFAQSFPLDASSAIIMETGGMKGRRHELTREEVHSILREAFQVRSIHSEYGMTELLSQAYAVAEGRFLSPPWMRVLIREEDDALTVFSDPLPGKSSAGGAINIIDLANLYSCSFIATDDLGKLYDDRSFEVLGRIDTSDIRGCALMVADT
jgi:hypothetical protein